MEIEQLKENRKFHISTIEELKKLIKRSDSILVELQDGLTLTIYSPYSNNSDNEADWYDDFVFGYDQDGEKFELYPDDILKILEPGYEDINLLIFSV